MKTFVFEADKNWPDGTTTRETKLIVKGIDADEAFANIIKDNSLRHISDLLELPNDYAAAPELLKACQAFITLFEESYMRPEDECNELLNIMMEAIKQASA